MSEAHLPLILLSKLVTTPGLKGQLLEPRWMDGKAGL